jgi:hypothetical protein
MSIAFVGATSSWIEVAGTGGWIRPSVGHNGQLTAKPASLAHFSGTSKTILRTDGGNAFQRIGICSTGKIQRL